MKAKKQKEKENSRTDLIIGGDTEGSVPALDTPAEIRPIQTSTPAPHREPKDTSSRDEKLRLLYGSSKRSNTSGSDKMAAAEKKIQEN